MSILNTAVQTANKDGNLSLMIYAIPNFPNPTVYRKILSILETHPAVTLIETTLPVTSGFSRYANQIIRHAHTEALQYGDGLSLLNDLQPFSKPSILVLYQQTMDALGYQPLLAKLQEKIDGVLFEWEAQNMEEYAKQTALYNLELIQCAAPDMSDAELYGYLALTEEKPLIYLASASMTGATLFDTKYLTGCLEKVKKYRPAAKILAGFGVRNSEDIRCLATIDGLDGVIIGTAFLEIMSQGADAVQRYLDTLLLALKLKM